MKTAILGGGLTGITLARLISDRGEDVVVLEQAPSIGGLCQSRTEAGFTFDTGGSHIIFSRDKEVLAFMEGVLGDNADTRRRNTKILYKGRYIKYPFENGIADLPIEDRFLCINEFVRTLIAAEKGIIPSPANFRDWIISTFGSGIADLYMIPYNEKIWNYPAEKMSAHWVEGRVPRPPVEDIIKSAIGIETEGYTHQLHFTYPVQGGIQSLIEAIAGPVRDRILTSFQVTEIRREGDRYVIAGGDELVTADRCISTIPLQHLIPAMKGVPPAVRESCDALRYNSLCCVSIGVKGKVPDISWLYIPSEKQGWFNRVSFPSNYSTEVAPPGHGSILVEITYNKGDSFSQRTDEEVIAHVTERLDALGIIDDPGSVVYTALYRQPFAYVVYDLEYLSNIERVRSYCASQGISLVGRFSQFEYLNMDGCIRSALDFVGSAS